MIQVWLYDENKVFIESTFVEEEVIENMTTVPLTIGYYKPTFNEELEEWYEGATDEEIVEIESSIPPREPSEIEVLQQENRILKAQVEALSSTADFHEELIAELATKVYA